MPSYERAGWLRDRATEATPGYSTAFWFLFLSRPEAFVRGRLPRLESRLQMIDSFLFLVETIFGAQQCVLNTRGDVRLLGICFLLPRMFSVWLGGQRFLLSSLPVLIRHSKWRCWFTSVNKTDEVSVLTQTRDTECEKADGKRRVL